MKTVRLVLGKTGWHKANHIRVVYAPRGEDTWGALLANSAVIQELGIQVAFGDLV